MLKLLDAICEVYDNPAIRPRAGMTFCNIAVHSVCAKMGYHSFDGLFANDIVDTMERSDKWLELPMSVVQSCANKGMLIIAGQQKFPHGHVVVIRIGREVWSNKWQQYVPKCMNVGDKNYISRGVNWAFKDIPKFYLFVGNHT